MKPFARRGHQNITAGAKSDLRPGSALKHHEAHCRPYGRNGRETPVILVELLVQQKLLSGSATTKERSLSLSVLQWPILDPGCHSG